MNSYHFTKPDDALRFVRGVDYPYVPSAIYPSEMAYFLCMCERAESDCIIESGRDQGYSTAVLGAYGEQFGKRVISIDIEMDREIARACRQRLSRYPKLELLAGDSFRILPRLLREERRRIALLVDGPKLHEAIFLSAASCATGTICMVAHHNIAYDNDVFPHFCKHFPNAQRLEQSEVYKSESFPEFRAWERSLTQGTHRDLERTTLLLSVLPKAGPDAQYLEGLTSKQTRAAKYVVWWWKLGAPNLWFIRGPKWVYSVVRSRFAALRRVLAGAN